MTEHAEKPSTFPHPPNEEEPADFGINEPTVPTENDEEDDA